MRSCPRQILEWWPAGILFIASDYRKLSYTNCKGQRVHSYIITRVFLAHSIKFNFGYVLPQTNWKSLQHFQGPLLGFKELLESRAE